MSTQHAEHGLTTPGHGGLEDGDRVDTLALFDGDEGTLALEDRRLLVTLLRQQVLTRERFPREWETLLARRALITSRLHDLFLDLTVDRERGVAFKVQLRADAAGRFPALLRDTAYTREETVLLVHLRRRRLAERAAGDDHVFVDTDECLEAVARYRPAHSTDVVGEQSRARKAVAQLVTTGVLEPTGQEDRYAVTAVIEAILPVDRLRAMLDALDGQEHELNPTLEAPEEGEDD